MPKIMATSTGMIGQSYGTLISDKIDVLALTEDCEYGSLIRCLIYYESKGNPTAVGDGGNAYGVLQFWKPTWEMYCVKKFGLTDYTDPRQQIICADYMLQQNWNNIRHWTTRVYCID
jgi:hypothetical protein